MAFKDRAEAGRALAGSLAHLAFPNTLVLALPRGGVPVAFEIAIALGATLDLLLVRKLGAPRNPELAIGAVVGHPHPATVLNDGIVAELGVTPDFIAAAAEREMAEIERRKLLYRRGRAQLPTRGGAVVVVDDGIATGATVRAALRALSLDGTTGRIVLAVPVAASEVAAELRNMCDEMVVLALPEFLGAVGRFYDNFDQVSDAEVIALLDRADARKVP